MVFVRKRLTKVIILFCHFLCRMKNHLVKSVVFMPFHSHRFIFFITLQCVLSTRLILAIVLLMKRIGMLAMVVFAAMTLMAATKLPVVRISTTTTIDNRKKVPARMQAGDYDGAIGIKLRGNSSLSFNQKKYTIELRDEKGDEKDFPLLGMPAHSQWVLLAPYNDVSMMRDPFAFQLWRDMGHWGPRTKMVELYVDDDYRGIYILCEAIKRGEQRVNVSKLKKTDVEGRELTGGYILRIDAYDQDDATFISKVPGIGEGIMTSQIVWSCIYPKKKNLQAEQLAYIEAFIDSVELTIQSEHFTDPQWGYARYIDVPSFVDYFIHTELSLNADGYKRSAYFYKEKDKEDGSIGKLFAGPVWDYNLAYGNCNFCNADNIEAWCFEGGNTQPTPALWQRLLQDPSFRKAVKTRYKSLRKGILSDKAINKYVSTQAKMLSPYAGRHFEKYPELLVSEEQKKNPVSGGFGGFPFGGFPQMGNDSIAGGFGGFPFGAFPPMGNDSIAGGTHGFPFGGFPQMGNDSIPGGFRGFPFGGFPQMGNDSIAGGFGGFPSMDGFSMDGFGGFGDAIGWYAAYRVSSYDEEIAVLREWLLNRLAFLDRNIERFDKDFKPHVQELKEITMPQFNGFPFFR